MTPLFKHLQDEVVQFFEDEIFPSYEASKDRSGFRWDTLERRGGSKEVVDVSILAQVGNAYNVLYKITNRQDWKYEAIAAAEDLIKLQEEDGRWECPYKNPKSSLEDVFSTADAVWFLARMRMYDNGLGGVSWLLNGKIEQGIEGPPLEGLIKFEQANHVGTILRAMGAFVESIGGGESPGSFVARVKREIGDAALSLTSPSWMYDNQTWAWDLDHPQTFKTNYHDLTVWGLVDAFNVLKDFRLLAPLKQAYYYIEEMGHWNIPGMYYEQWKPPEFGGGAPFGDKWGLSYSGIITLAKMCYFDDPDIYFDDPDRGEVRLAESVCALLDRCKKIRIAGWAPYYVERRLVITRGLATFLEVIQDE